jgi:hypothetical protein
MQSLSMPIRHRSERRDCLIAIFSGGLHVGLGCRWSLTPVLAQK